MIYVKLTRDELVAHGACTESLVVFNDLCRRQGQIKDALCLEWTWLHSIWLSVWRRGDSAWLISEGLIPAINAPGAYLARAYLAGANLHGANLARAYLHGANLTGANLTGANLAGADLAGANLNRANLYGANLTGANLTGANLAGADLAGANLAGANLNRANLNRANLYGAYVGIKPNWLPEFWEVKNGYVYRRES